MQEFSSKVREIVELAEKTAGFHEVDVTFLIRLQGGNESYFLRILSDSDSTGTGTATEHCGTHQDADPQKALDWF